MFLQGLSSDLMKVGHGAVEKMEHWEHGGKLDQNIGWERVRGRCQS